MGEGKSHDEQIAASVDRCACGAELVSCHGCAGERCLTCDPYSEYERLNRCCTIDGPPRDSRHVPSAAIVQALDQAVASARTIHSGTPLAVDAPLGPVTHFIIGADEWQALVLAIRKDEADARHGHGKWDLLRATTRRS